MNYEWNKESIIESVTILIESYYKQSGKMITSREWDRLKLTPTRATIRKYLGMSFNTLISSLNLKASNPTPHEKYSKQQLILYLYNFVEEFDRIPTAEDFQKKRPPGYPSISTYYRVFDNFPKALEAAGLPQNERGYSEHKLLSIIHKFAEEYGRSPYIYEFSSKNRPKNYPKSDTFIRVFGSMENAIIKAGYSPLKRENSYWTADNIKEVAMSQITRFYETEGRIPSRKEWDDLYMEPSRNTIKRVLDLSFNDFILDLDLIPSHDSPKRYTDEELIYFLHYYHQENGKVPTADDFRENQPEYPNPHTYQRRFGTWDKAILVAGFDSNKYLDVDYLRNEIFRFIQEYGRTPTSNNFNYSNNFPSTKPYKRIWGSFNQCLLELNLTPASCENKNAYSKKVISIDGHICDSRDEAFVDDFLFIHQIPHKKEKLNYPYHKKYNINKKKRCDFIIENLEGELIYVEYAGLFSKKSYQENLYKKILLTEELNLKLIIIYPWQLGQLNQVFKDWL